MTYQYDFFLSFPRDCTAGDWVVKIFHPLLKECFRDECANLPKVYCFTSQSEAVYWPHELQNALMGSRFMISILTPPYFYESRWCRAEWETMKAREAAIGWGSIAEPRSLIFPIAYSGVNALPESVRQIRGEYDFSAYALPDEQFRNTAAYLDMRTKMRNLARKLDILRETAPTWNEKWPFKRPDEVPLMPTPPVSVPRL